MSTLDVKAAESEGVLLCIVIERSFSTFPVITSTLLNQLTWFIWKLDNRKSGFFMNGTVHNKIDSTITSINCICLDGALLCIGEGIGFKNIVQNLNSNKLRTPSRRNINSFFLVWDYPEIIDFDVSEGRNIMFPPHYEAILFFPNSNRPKQV